MIKKTLSLLLLFLFCTSLSGAEYADPIDLPAVQYPGAEQALLLDVTTAGDRLIAVGERGTVVYSDDHGASWQQADVATRRQLNAVSFADAQSGWAVGEDAVIVHTADGGATWERQFDDRESFDPGPLLDVQFLDDQTGFAVGVYNKLFKTSDGGKTWEDWQDHIDNLDGWHLTAIQRDGDNLYIAGEAGYLYRSDDGGESFAPIEFQAPGSYFGLTARTTDDGIEQLVIPGIAGQLVACENGPESCRELDSGVEVGLLAVDWLADGSAVIVGNDGIALKLSADLGSVEPFPTAWPTLFGGVTVSQGKVVIVGYGGVQVVDDPTAAAASK